MIAIVAGEDDADALADTLNGDAGRLCSTVSAWETVAGLCRAYAVEDAREDVKRFLDAGEIRFAALGDWEWRLATEAYAGFRKGRHPAALNMGDCLAYACAKSNRARLLYKGGDFARTDLA